MTTRKLIHLASQFLSVVILLAAIGITPVRAQTSDEIAKMKERAGALLEQTNYVEALPLLEKLAQFEPDNGETRFYLASALLGQAANTKDEQVRKVLRVRSRNEFIKARELGVSFPNVDVMIESLPIDGSDGGTFSTNKNANDLMKEGEALFVRGKLDEALQKYQKALELEPKLYEAALLSGDVYLQQGNFDQAEVWYQKAIAIDPNRETAYRYSATPLMKQKKTEAALVRYIEAFITEPYNRFARSGLVGWGQATDSSLAHPDIKIPTNITFDKKGNSKINLEAGALLGKDDGGAAWIIYGITRASWRKQKFVRTYPNEKAYRHSLAEEADALRSVVTLAFSEGKKPTNRSLALLKKLNDEGLLEAYVLLARPDEGIALDHPPYLKENREKLRRYMTEYVVKGGG